MRSILTSLVLVAACGAASAQTIGPWKTDSATMGQGYAKDVYRKLANNYSDTATGNNWTLAFQMIPQGGPSSNVAVFANHVRQNVGVYSLHYQASAKFATLTAADTVGRTSQPLYNSVESWATGALNQMASPSNLFDYGWGAYNMTSHNVVGDSLYLLKTASGDYKLWVQKYVSNPIDSIRYEFRIAKFDGSGDQTVKIYRKDGFTNSLFGYYNAVNNTILNREPGRDNWELAFTRYVEEVTMVGITMMSPVMGVLTNVGVTVAEVTNPDADAAAAGYASQSYSDVINTIGYDWKQQPTDSSGRPTGPFVTDTAKTYLIKSGISGKYYQLVFIGFSGTSAGKTVYKYRELGNIPQAVSNVEEAVTVFMLVPNPTAGETQILLDVKQGGTARLLVTDAMGRTVKNSTLQLNTGLNGYNVSLGHAAAGTYFVTVTNGSWSKTAQLLIQK